MFSVQSQGSPESGILVSSGGCIHAESSSVRYQTKPNQRDQCSKQLSGSGEQCMEQSLQMGTEHGTERRDEGRAWNSEVRWEQGMEQWGAMQAGYGTMGTDGNGAWHSNER